MPLVPAKCPECGGNINIDSDKKAAICEFCKQPFVVEDAINNFNMTYNITNNNEIKADVVNIYENSNRDFIIEGGILQKYVGDRLHVIVPNTVKAIGEEAFKDQLIESVEIPESVKTIKRSAFYNCKDLKKVIMRNSVEVIEDGGSYPGPQNYACYGSGAFEKCSSLEEVITSPKLRYIGDGAFKDCNALKSIKKLDYVEHIGRCAFFNCGELSSIELGQSVATIGGYAFSGCQAVKSLDFSNAVGMKGDHTFSGCSELEELILPLKIENDILGEWRDTFSDCTKLKSIKIPEGVKELSYEDGYDSKGIFHNCTNLERIVLPSSLEAIVGKFIGGISLKYINIPAHVRHISDMFFSECCKLIDVDINGSILRKNIGAFIYTPMWNGIKDKLDYCPYCGSDLKGLFTKRCSKCGK